MTPIDDIRRRWERRWALRDAPGFDAAGPSDTVRALQLFEPHVIEQAFSVGPRLVDALGSARRLQGLPGLRLPVPCRAVTLRPMTAGPRWRRPRSVPLQPSHRRVVISS